jgi:hypothetical protein
MEAFKHALAELPQGPAGPELELGADGETAWQFFQGLGIDDPKLENMLRSASPDASPFDVLALWNPTIAQSVLTVPAPEQQEPAQEPEQPVAAENDDMTMPKGTMESKGSMVQEVAKIVKSFYNKDNPTVGPFRGEEGIALDVKKQIAEKFGDDAGDQAHQMAEQFMEKLSQEWTQRHGQVDDGGLARLKELVGNIKGKVESIGDRGVSSQDFNTNIMSAEDHVNELSSATLKSYSNAAGQEVHGDQRDAEQARDRAYHADQHGEKSKSLNWADEADWLDKRAEKRAGGIARATTKIAQREDSTLETIMKLAGLKK